MGRERKKSAATPSGPKKANRKSDGPKKKAAHDRENSQSPAPAAGARGGAAASSSAAQRPQVVQPVAEPMNRGPSNDDQERAVVNPSAVGDAHQTMINVFGASGDPLEIVLHPAPVLTAADDKQLVVKVSGVMMQIAAARKVSRWRVVVFDTDTDQMMNDDGNAEGFFLSSATIPLIDLIGDPPRRTLGFYVVDAGVHPHFPGGVVVKSRLCFAELFVPNPRVFRQHPQAFYASLSVPRPPKAVYASPTGGLLGSADVEKFLCSADRAAQPTCLSLAYLGGPGDPNGRKVHYARINDLTVRQSRGYTLGSLTLNTQNTEYIPRSILSSEDTAILFRGWDTSCCTLEKLHLTGPLPASLLEQLARNCPPGLRELELSWLAEIGPGPGNWSSRDTMPAIYQPEPAIYQPEFVTFLKSFAHLLFALPVSVEKIAHVSIDNDGNSLNDRAPSSSNHIDTFPLSAIPASVLEDVASAFAHLENLEILDLSLGKRLLQAIAAKMSCDANFLPALKVCGSGVIANARPGVELRTDNFWSVRETVGLV